MSTFQPSAYGATAPSKTYGMKDNAGYEYKVDPANATITVTKIPVGGGNLNKVFEIGSPAGNAVLKALAEVSIGNYDQLVAAVGKGVLDGVGAVRGAKTTITVPTPSGTMVPAVVESTTPAVAAGEAAEPIYKRKWFWPVAGVAAAGVVFAVVMLWPKSK